jgi:hypothetical protein
VHNLKDPSNLRSRVNTLGLRAAQLVGRLTADTVQQAALTSRVADAKGRNALGPQVASVFEGMQHLSHQRSVGSLETLLSAILKDVLPDEGSIRLVPSYKANNTHLDILLEKHGKLEDVLDGNGGAVTNVVCAGLRFAALSRTGNRRLMVLDEPDCWVSLDRAAGFARTIAQVATKGRFQTMVVSHKHPSIFEGSYNIVRFSQNVEGRVEATALSPQLTSWASVEEPGIRKIELINVRRHEHTVVPCFPGATVYLGKSNLGKSTALMTAFKAVAYGESDDSVIRHDCEEARIIFHLEGNQRLEWSRHIKRSPAVVYKHYLEDALVAEGRPKTRNQAPEWVEDLLGISRVDDMDIQVGNQKLPVFLLNDSAPRRAQILSVGRESSYLPSLMRKYEQMKAADRELVKQGETELSRIKMRLTYLHRAPKFADAQGVLLARAEQLIRALEMREQLELVLGRLEQRGATVARLSLTLQVLVGVPEFPEIADCSALERTFVRLEKASRLRGVAPLPEIPSVPALHDLLLIAESGRRISRGERIAAASAGVDMGVPAVPALTDSGPLSVHIGSLARRVQAAAGAETLVRQAAAAADNATKALNDLIDELGQACPLCGGVMGHEGSNHKAAHVH